MASREYFAAFAASLGSFCSGTIFAFSSPSGPILTNGTDPYAAISLTEEQYGHFSSSVNLALAVGTLPSGILMRAFGRKWTMIMSVFPFVAGWILMATSTGFWMLMGGRLLTGFAGGLSFPVVPTYIAEISSANIRGKLCSSHQIMLCLGILYAYILAPIFDSFRWMAVACVGPPVLHLLCLFFTKESPVYLIANNKNEKAKEALLFFRKKGNISNEFALMTKFMKERENMKKGFKNFLNPSIWRPFLMMVTLVFFFQSSGINSVIFNLNQIFETVNSSISSKISPILIGLIQPIFTVAAGFVVDRWGRKTLLIISTMLMSLSLVSVGIYFYEENLHPDAAALVSWLPLLATCFYFASFSLGLGPVPWIILGEIFPPEIRESASSAVMLLSFVFSYVVTVIYIPLKTQIGLYGIFWFHGALCLLSAIFCFLFVRETKGKTPQEIARLFAVSS